MLYARVNGGSASGAPNLSDSSLSAVVTGIIVEEEQIGPRRYVARLGVMFDRARVSRFLGVSGVIRRSPPMLILPVQWVGNTPLSFEDRTPWERAWLRYRSGESPIDYVRASGGYFLDAQIHDIDLLCWIAGERPEKVFAAGACVFDERIGAEGDVDLAMTTLMMPSGALAHINNSRACVYGFDQRLEVFGTKGMVQTSNQRDDPLIRWTGDRTEAKAPLKHFFLERYDASFFHALDEFYHAVTNGRAPSATEHDGRDALAIALACSKSRKSGVAEVPEY